MLFFIPPLVLHFASTKPLSGTSLPAAASPGAQSPTTIPSSLDLSIPTSPALDVLGLSASKVVQASSLQQVAWSIVTGSDQTGNNQQGIAYTANPSQLNLITKSQLFDYYYKPANELVRAWYNTQFSVAATQSSNDPQAVSHAAIGASVPLLDNTDWRTNPAAMQSFQIQVKKLLPVEFFPMDATVTDDKPAYAFTRAEQGMIEKSMNDAATPSAVKSELNPLASEAKKVADQMLAERPDIGDRVSPDSPVKPLSDGDAKLYKALCNDVNSVQKTYMDDTDKSRWAAVQKIVKKLSDDSWNRQKLDIAAGALTQDAGGAALSSNAYGAWADYANTLGHYLQGLVYVKYSNGLYTTIASMKSPAVIRGAYTVAGRIRGGSSSDGFFAEFEYLQGKPVSAATLYSRTFQLAWEHKLGDQWLEFAIGRDLQNAHKFIFGLNFAINTSPKQLLTNQGTPAVKAGN